MRGDSIRQHLGERNPWWKAQVLGEEATAWTDRHPVLQGLASYDIGYRAGVLDDVATDPLGDRLIVLSGPRRIGKSVAMLQLAEALCERGDVDPRQIIHVPCDMLTLQDVRRVLTLARSMTESVDLDGARPRVWLFDEITFGAWLDVGLQGRAGQHGVRARHGHRHGVPMGSGRGCRGQPHGWPGRF
ncbi:AAA family ATPase [Isoptericola croceus]|uniref:AAA family ATPase n=1 Tax=Isoptericola croceus TaxID=3031406 RepID=UPI0023F6F067|nr:AAA family ATPase [Isoptericola croceus]